jgi:hypothetical protein
VPLLSEHRHVLCKRLVRPGGKLTFIWQHGLERLFFLIIQEPVSTLSPGTEEVSRTDEYGLIYLSHDQYYTIPSIFPFALFGSIAIIDTNIGVR